MKKYYLSMAIVCLLVCMSCSSVPPAYRSNALEERGELAVLSNISLVGEVEIGSQDLGIFSSTEKTQKGEKRFVLFVLKDNNKKFGEIFNGKGIGSYQFSNTGSITLDQAKNLVVALEDYLVKDASEFSKSELYNFELATGLVDGEDKNELKNIEQITFIINYSISGDGKVFRAIFYGNNGYRYYELTDENVKHMKDILSQIDNNVESVRSVNS